jgi:hypothetical protein
MGGATSSQQLQRERAHLQRSLYTFPRESTASPPGLPDHGPTSISQMLTCMSTWHGPGGPPYRGRRRRSSSPDGRLPAGRRPSGEPRRRSPDRLSAGNNSGRRPRWRFRLRLSRAGPASPPSRDRPITRAEDAAPLAAGRPPPWPPRPPPRRWRRPSARLSQCQDRPPSSGRGRGRGRGRDGRWVPIPSRPRFGDTRPSFALVRPPSPGHPQSESWGPPSSCQHMPGSRPHTRCLLPVSLPEEASVLPSIPPGGQLLLAVHWSRVRSIRFALQPAKPTS